VKGSPLLRALLLLASLLTLSVPLRWVTQPETTGISPAQAESQPSESANSTDRKLSLVLSFTRGADRVELRHLGKTFWSKEHPGPRETLDVSLPFPEEGIELGVMVKWPGQELSALRLQLTTPDGAELDRSAWGTETMEAVLSFP
jgi:hypothetical protein